MPGSETKVHSAGQAVEMAKAAYGQPTLDLAIAVETMQDLWIVSIGPDTAGATHSYLITEWDERAVARELGGEVSLLFAPDGLTCRIRAPLSKMGLLVAEPPEA